MKKIVVGIFAIGMIAGVASCKKDDKSSTPSLVGTWTLSEYGADANSNNAVDGGETGPASAAGISGSITFENNNHYSATVSLGGFTESENGSYTYANNTITTVSTSNDTTVRVVNSLQSNKLIVKDDNGGGGSDQWEIYTK